MTYLTASNRKGLGDKVKAFDTGELDARDKNVVVIGGGDTAMDCVRTAVRQGATSVKCLYRRDRENMPGSKREVKNAIDEGVEFVWLSSPKAVLTRGAGRGKASGVRAAAMRLGLADASGRQAPEEVPGSEEDHAADLVIKGARLRRRGFAGEVFRTARWRRRAGARSRSTARRSETSLPGVFAAGDIVRGASLVVWAIRDGRDAAAAIHKQLAAKAKVAQGTRAYAVAAAE